MESGEGGFLQTSQGKKLSAKWVRISISAQQCNTSQCIAFHNIALHFKGLHKRIIGINIIGATTPARCGQLVVIGRIPRYCFYLRCFTAVQWIFPKKYGRLQGRRKSFKTSLQFTLFVIAFLKCLFLAFVLSLFQKF